VARCTSLRGYRRRETLNLVYRWFCRLDLNDAVPDHSSFSKNRHGRFRESDSVLVGSWFANSIYQIETIADDDGTKTLNAADVNSLTARTGVNSGAIGSTEMPGKRPRR